MGAGNTSLLLEDDGRARVKQVVSNSQMHAALLDGNLLLAWRHASYEKSPRECDVGNEKLSKAE
jgi:hypothetical protein